MSVKSFLQSRLVNTFLSEKSLKKSREKSERNRKKMDRPHKILYFHQADDPYSHLCLQVLPGLQAKYPEVKLEIFLVDPPKKMQHPSQTYYVGTQYWMQQFLQKNWGLNLPTMAR